MGADPLNDGRLIAAIENALQILRDDEVELVFLHQGEQVIARCSREYRAGRRRQSRP